MFESVQAYDNAIAALGVVETDYPELNKKFKDFDKRSNAAFNQYMKGRNLSVNVFNARESVPSYVNPNSQGMWCSWCAALMFAPSLRERSPRDIGTELALFRIYLRTCGFEEYAGFEGYEKFEGTSSVKIVLLKWEAWKAAMDFGYAI